MCDLGRFVGGAVDFVGVFVDESGSMDRGTVAASLAKFDADLLNAGLTVSQVFNPNEDWITPFTTDLAPMTQPTASAMIASASANGTNSVFISTCEHCKLECAGDSSCVEESDCEIACVGIDNLP